MVRVENKHQDDLFISRFKSGQFYHVDLNLSRRNYPGSSFYFLFLSHLMLCMGICFVLKSNNLQKIILGLTQTENSSLLGKSEYSAFFLLSTSVVKYVTSCPCKSEHERNKNKKSNLLLQANYNLKGNQIELLAN